MEFIEGKNISDYIRDKPETINEIFQQVIRGFSCLAENKIVHRNIRPQNILINNEDIVKIIDFGFGKSIQYNGDSNKTYSINHPNEYGSPNEFNDRKYTFSTDIYFVGQLFRQLISDFNI